jgi:hypothetical protein
MREGKREDPTKTPRRTCSRNHTRTQREELARKKKTVEENIY